MSSPLPAVFVDDLTVAYQRKPVLWDVEVSIPQGKLVAIVGPNGAGKSTLLKSILGLIPKASGRVEILGEALEKQRDRIAYVPQRESVDWDFPVSALDVVTMGLYRKIGWLMPVRKRHKAKALEAMTAVGMEAFADRQISQLSGGQQQRVFLARAIVQDAQIMFMDEPFAGVDASTEKTIVSVLKRLRDEGRTLVVVHHDLQTVPHYFDEVILLNMRVVGSGPVGEVFTEENLRKTYGGKASLLAEAVDAMARR